MRHPKVTVLMPCYNAAGYIADAIQSVLQQTMTDFELLIVNDGSTDNTVEIIQFFNDDRIVLIDQNKLGIAAALNRGLIFARAGYIARFDADDICAPDRLQKQYEFMDSHPDYIIVGSAADYVDDAGNYVFTHLPAAETDEEIQKLPYFSCPFIHASVMYKKEAVTGFGYSTYAHSFEDHLLWLQLKGNGKMYNLQDALLSVRINPGSFTMDERKRSREFHRIKTRALRDRHIEEQQGSRLLKIIHKQNNPVVKRAAYHSLLAKKFLWNNYDPKKARLNMRKAIRLNAFDPRDYALLVLSYLPEKMLRHIHSLVISNR